MDSYSYEGLRTFMQKYPIYEGKRDIRVREGVEWIVDEEANQKRIEQLKQDKSSDPATNLRRDKNRKKIPIPIIRTRL